MTNDGCDTSNDYLLAVKSHENFAYIGKHLVKDFNPSTHSNNYLRYMGERSLNDFKFEPVTEATIRIGYCVFFEKL